MDWLIVVIGFILGTVLGSLAKALADRSGENRSFMGRSYCESCQHQLHWYDLFPVFSYLSLKGKCRYCHKSIPFTNFLTELGLGILLATLFKLSLSPAFINTLITSGIDWQSGILLADFIFKIFVVTVLVIIFLTDWQTGLIPDRITYPSTIIVAVYFLLSVGLKIWLIYQSLVKDGPFFSKYLLPPYSNYLYDIVQRLLLPLFWNAVAGLSIASIFVLLIIVTRGRGMGWGDVKYVFFLGLVLGFPNVALAVFLAFFGGSIASLLLIGLRRKNFGQTIPFGPFLSLGALATLFWGAQILDWYYHNFTFSIF